MDAAINSEYPLNPIRVEDGQPAGQDHVESDPERGPSTGGQESGPVPAQAASPQIEDGHIDIANEIGEVLARTNLSAYESRILWALWRKTYGWHKKADQISFTQFEKMTGLKRRHVQRTLDELIKRGIVTRIGYSRIITYGFQKDYTKWRDITKRGYDHPQTLDNPASYPKGVTGRSYPKGVTDRNPNRLTQKKITKEKNVEGEPLRLALFLLEEIRKNKADFKGPRDIQKWAKSFDLMIRIDSLNPERIEKVIRWVQADKFWWCNVLSADTLRDKFQNLEAKIQASNGARERPKEKHTILT